MAKNKQLTPVQQTVTYGVLIALGAVTMWYWANPADFIPDVTGFFGFVDDIVVGLVALKISWKVKDWITGNVSLRKLYR